MSEPTSFNLDFLASHDGNMLNRRSDVVTWSDIQEESDNLNPEPAEGRDVRRPYNAIDNFISENELSDEELSSPHAQCFLTPPLEREDFHASEDISHWEYVRWLEEWGPFLMESKNPQLTCKVLLKLADDIRVLPPGGNTCVDDFMDVSCWRRKVKDLTAEMKTVAETCAPELCHAHEVLVLTSWPYTAFLRRLVQEIMI